MRHRAFERPTEHYDERVSHIDEQICSLLMQRKEVANNHPGYPPFEVIAKWADSYGLYEDFLKMLFSVLLSEEHYKPVVEPAEFRKLIPVLKHKEHDEFFYTISSVRQYSNASVVNLDIDWDETNELLGYSKEFNNLELLLPEPYSCRFHSGVSNEGHASYSYVVAPSLPDDLSGISFVFRKFSDPFTREAAGSEVVIETD